MTQRAVVLFARTPEAEARAKGLSAGAARLFEALIATWLRAADAAGAVAIIACSPDSRGRFSAIAPKVPRQYVDQAGRTFGEKLANAAISVSNFSPVLIAGIDAPPLDLDGAFDALERGHADGAIAPAHDGGVNVIGFCQAPAELLRSFAIEDRTIAARCLRHFHRVHKMTSASDIDSVARIASAIGERPWRVFRAVLVSAITPPDIASAVFLQRTARTYIPSRGPPRV
jgi:glycosyltransferase A (GT-A) superfamily protein (DUF2064 family)